MNVHPVKILHTTICVPFEVAYEFTHQPHNFPRWAAGLSKSLQHTEKGWIASTPEGDAIVQFSERNSHGVLDHWVRLNEKPVTYVPLRMIANGDATEVELVLFRQPHMTDEAFARDAASVTSDLSTLKRLLESMH